MSSDESAGVLGLLTTWIMRFSFSSASHTEHVVAHTLPSTRQSSPLMFIHAFFQKVTNTFGKAECLVYRPAWNVINMYIQNKTQHLFVFQTLLSRVFEIHRAVSHTPKSFFSPVLLIAQRRGHRFLRHIKELSETHAFWHITEKTQTHSQTQTYKTEHRSLQTNGGRKSFAETILKKRRLGEYICEEFHWKGGRKMLWPNKTCLLTCLLQFYNPVWVV